MRWNQTKDRRATRKISRFLIIPKCIKGECRWLEYAKWIQIRDDDKWIDARWL
jgi:hypothetical protein